MKKLKQILSLLLLLLTLGFLGWRALGDSGRGHWVYGKDGSHKGCVSPGDDCKWGGDLVK